MNKKCIYFFIFVTTFVRAGQIQIPSSIIFKHSNVINNNHTIQTSQSSQSIVPLPTATTGTTDKKNSSRPSLFKWNLSMSTLYTIGAAVAIGGASLIGYEKIMEHSIQKKDRWGRWKEHIALAVLNELPLNEIIKELFKSAQERYGNQKNILLLMLYDLSSEKKQLNHYLRSQTVITLFKLRSIAGDNKELIAHAQEQIDRIDFIEKTVITWLYSIESKIG